MWNTDEYVTGSAIVGIIRGMAGRAQTPMTSGRRDKGVQMPLKALADRDVNQDVLEGRAPSVGALFRSRVRETPDAPAYLYFAEGSTELTTLTWRQTYETVEQWAAGLI